MRRAGGVEAKIVPELLCLGNLQIHDGEQARLNQYLAFKFIQHWPPGPTCMPATQRVLPVPFDHVRMYCNMNNWGTIGSLKGLVHHQAQLQHFIWDTPAGADMQEREPDISPLGLRGIRRSPVRLHGFGGVYPLEQVPAAGFSGVQGRENTRREVSGRG